MAYSQSRQKPVDGSSGAPETTDIAIELRNLSKNFGSTEVLKDVNLRVKRGHTAVVLGGSGAGKSVLVKHIVRLLDPDEGEVWVEGTRVDQLKDGNEIDAIRLNIGFLFQSGALFDSMTVFENLSFILERNSQLNREERHDRIMEMLEWVNLPEKAESYPAELSGGQKKRIGLARAMILHPKIILYDEPTTGLDPVSVRMVSDLIVRLQKERNITSVAITHDLLCAEIIADEVHFMHGGRFVESGTLSDLQKSDHPTVREFFGR